MQKVLTERANAGAFELEYHLLEESREDGRKDYGIAVCSSSGDGDCVRGITVCWEEATALLHLLARNTVTPVTLRDVMEDWLS